MKIILVGERCYCTAKEDFSLNKLKEEIKQHLKMKRNSFAYNYSIKIFIECFRYAKDLKKEYIDYYMQEYDNFKIYLYQKELLEKNEIALLMLNDNQTVLKLQPSLNNYNVKSIIENDENRVKILNEILEKLNL